jgi:quercetin dioxygenase-like cupin family protein
MTLATGHLASVVGLPFFFRLYQVHLPAAGHASYQGSSAMLYDLSGAVALAIEGRAAQRLDEGAGVFIAAGQEVTINAPVSEPAAFLVFLLTTRPNQRRPLLDVPAVARELYRTPEPLPGLKSGEYEFVLRRVTFPAGMPAGAPHYRTGAALTYVLAGTGSLIADGKTEPMLAGMAAAAPSGLFHQWANPGTRPLIIVQASIRQEGAPAIIPEPAR